MFHRGPRNGRGHCLDPPHHAHDKLHVVGIPKALDVHVLLARPACPTRSPVAAISAQEAARKTLRCMHRRDRSSWRCVVELRTAKILPLEDVPLETLHGGLVAHQTHCLGGGKGIPATYRNMKAHTAWLQIICLPSWHICSAIWLAPSTAREGSR